MNKTPTIWDHKYWRGTGRVGELGEECEFLELKFRKDMKASKVSEVEITIMLKHPFLQSLNVEGGDEK